MKIFKKLMVALAASLFIFTTVYAMRVDPESDVGAATISSDRQAAQQRIEIRLPSPLPELEGVAPVTMQEAQSIASASVAEIIELMAIVEVDENQNENVLITGQQFATVAASFPSTRNMLQGILDKAVEISISKENLTTFLPYMRSANAYHPKVGYAVQKKFFKSRGIDVPPYTDEEVELMADPQFLSVYRLYVTYMETGAIATGRKFQNEILPMIVQLQFAVLNIINDLQQSDAGQTNGVETLYASTTNDDIFVKKVNLTDAEAEAAYDIIYHEMLAQYLPVLTGVIPEDRLRGEALIEAVAHDIAQIVTSEEVYPYYLDMKKSVAEHPEWEEQATLVASMTKYGQNVSLLDESSKLMEKFEFQQMVAVMRNWQRAFDPLAFPVLAGLQIDLNQLRYEDS